MPLVCIGLSHQTAPVDVRERHAFPASRMSEALVALRDYEAVREAAMLQTCGRLEIYAEVDDYEAGVAQLKSFLGNFGHRAVDYDIESYLYTLLGGDAVQHLFRVATGLDSMLIGEAEILGQVKEAYAQAQHARSLGKILHRLFREALRAGKSARTQTRIGASSASVATAAVEAAKERLGPLDGKSVVVIGAGKMGRSAVNRLRREGAGNVIVANRSIARARELIAETGIGEALELPGLLEALANADLVVTSTGASDFVITRERVVEAMALRPERPLFVVDIAVPRDAEPDVATVPNVTLVDIDGLKSVVDEKLGVRRASIPEVEEIVTEYAAHFGHWYGTRAAVPLIATLTQKAEAIRVGELERLFARCPELTERERMLVTGMSMTVVSKLLHSAIVKIADKVSGDANEALSHARVLDELFELNLTDHIAGLIANPIAADVVDG
jgi:glutamyl-tRNA reductase